MHILTMAKVAIIAHCDSVKAESAHGAKNTYAADEQT